MATPAVVTASAASFTSNQRLLGAALAGLLCLAPAACTIKDNDPPAGTAGSGEPSGSGGSSSLGGEPGATPTAGDSGSGGAAGSETAPVSTTGGAGDSAGAGGHDSSTAGAGDAAGSGGSTAGVGGAPPEVAHITSSAAVGVLTEEDFKALCDARGGTVEVMPHCGGFATAKGFSYDNGTQLLSEHTCAGANTCGGWNCVIVD